MVGVRPKFELGLDPQRGGLSGTQLAGDDELSGVIDRDERGKIDPAESPATRLAEIAFDDTAGTPLPDGTFVVGRFSLGNCVFVNGCVIFGVLIDRTLALCGTDTLF